AALRIERRRRAGGGDAVAGEVIHDPITARAGPHDGELAGRCVGRTGRAELGGPARDGAIGRWQIEWREIAEPHAPRTNLDEIAFAFTPIVDIARIVAQLITRFADCFDDATQRRQVGILPGIVTDVVVGATARIDTV